MATTNATLFIDGSRGTLLIDPLSVTGTFTLSGPIAVSNFPADQVVHFATPQHTIVDSGSVNVGNFPADQVVHFAAPQHVVVDSSALPADAATEDSLADILAAIRGTNQLLFLLVTRAPVFNTHL